MERAQALLLALTGNFGRKGTGMRGWNSGQLQVASMTKERLGMEGFVKLAGRALDLEDELLAEDPTLTEEMRAIELERREGREGVVFPFDVSPLSVPSAFYWYYHCGFDGVWNRTDWSDPAMTKPLGEYLEEAVAAG